MLDINGHKILLGSIVKPLFGFWKGFEGEVIEIKGNEYPITVQFEERETNSYYSEQIEVII